MGLRLSLGILYLASQAMGLLGLIYPCRERLCGKHCLLLFFLFVLTSQETKMCLNNQMVFAHYETVGINFDLVFVFPWIPLN